MEEEAKSTSTEDSLIKKFLFKVGPYILGILFVAGITVYAIRQKPEIFGLSKGSTMIQAEVDLLVNEVGKLITLPSDEKPTVATITDIEKLKDQPFFANAKNGDKVLIYTNAKKAILYRSEEKKIIEVGAVNINQTSPSPAPEGEEEKATPTPTPTPTKTPEGGE